MAPHKRSRTSRAARVLGRIIVTTTLAGLAGAFALVSAPRAVGFSTVVVQGGSMGSTAPIGSLVLARPAAPQDVRVGDVIVMRREDAAGATPRVLHRVIEVDQRDDQVVVRTKGDANPSPDPERYVIDGPAPRMHMAIPWVGSLVTMLSTSAGWILGVLLPSTFLTALALLRIWAPTGDQPSALTIPTRIDLSAAT